MDILKGDNKMANEYLMKEYELNFEQLRFYDDKYSNTLKYLYTLSSAVSTALFAVYKLPNFSSQDFFGCQLFLSIVVFVATLLLYLTMIQNRLYFVFTARQLNAIRKFLMDNAAGTFKNNQLYISTNFSALKPSSVHTFQLIGAALISSLFAGISAYAISPAFGQKPCIAAAILIFILIALVEIFGGFWYLVANSKKSADQAIHCTDMVSEAK
jgi:hypothetical protein